MADDDRIRWNFPQSWYKSLTESHSILIEHRIALNTGGMFRLRPERRFQHTLHVAWVQEIVSRHWRRQGGNFTAWSFPTPDNVKDMHRLVAMGSRQPLGGFKKILHNF
jgi:hypothetical protein